MMRGYLLSIAVLTVTVNVVASLPAGQLSIVGCIRYGNITGKMNVAGATYIVELRDTAAQDTFAITIANATGPCTQFPVCYRIIYYQADVTTGPSFSLQAKIQDLTGRLLFITNVYVSATPTGPNRTKFTDIPVIRVDGSVQVNRKRDTGSRRVVGKKRSIRNKLFSTVA